MYHGKYVGENKMLKGETALLEDYCGSFVMAQFDNRELGVIAFGWFLFFKDNFERTRPEKDPDA